MGERNYKINDPIKVVYQAPNKETGLVVTAEIYLPNGSQDSNFLDMILDEVGHKGVYKQEFTPDEMGDWIVIVHLPGDEGQVVKRYSVGAHNVHGLGLAIAETDGKVDDLDSDVAAVDGKVDAVTGKVDIVQTTADSIETKINTLSSSVGGLDTPPMIS